MSKYIGCYKDTEDRDLPLYKGKGTAERCKILAKKNNKKYFGLQNYQNDINNAECWLGDSYGQFGNINTCDYNREDDLFYGKEMTNAIYETDGISIETKQSYSEFRNKIQDWCQNLKDQGIYNQDEYQKCLQMYQNIEFQASEGELNQMGQDEIKYQYGFTQNPLYQDNPVSTVIVDDYQKLYLINHDGYYLITNEQGQLKMVKEPEIDKEREWNLVKLSQNTYGIRSTYGKYLIMTPDLQIDANRNDISPWVQFIVEKREDKYSLKSNSHGGYLTSDGEEIKATPSWTQFSNWLVENKNQTNNLESQSFLELYDHDHLMVVKNGLISKMEESYKKYLDKIIEVNYAEQYIQELELLRKRQFEFLAEKIDQNIDQMTISLKQQEDKLADYSRRIMRYYFNIVNQLFRLAQANHFGDLYEYKYRNVTTRGLFPITRRQRYQVRNQNGLSAKIIQAKDDIFYVYRTHNTDYNKVVVYIKEKLKELNREDRFNNEYEKIRRKFKDLDNDETRYQEVLDQISTTKKRIDLAFKFKPQIEETIINMRIKEINKHQQLKAELIRHRYLALDNYKEAEKEVETWKSGLNKRMEDIQKDIDQKLSTINYQLGKINNLSTQNQKIKNNQENVKYSNIKGDQNLELIEIQQNRHSKTFWGIIIIGTISLVIILYLIYNIQFRISKYYF